MSDAIYYARSIRGKHSRDDQIVNDMVLWTIRAKGFMLAMDLAPTVRIPEQDWDSHIFLRDLDWIDRSVALIAEVTNPSLGVGYEIAYANHVRHLPILCLAEKDANVSAMIAGGFGVVFYRDTADLKEQVEEFLESITDKEKRNERR